MYTNIHSCLPTWRCSKKNPNAGQCHETRTVKLQLAHCIAFCSNRLKQAWNVRRNEGFFQFPGSISIMRYLVVHGNSISIPTKFYDVRSKADLLCSAFTIQELLLHGYWRLN